MTEKKAPETRTLTVTLTAPRVTRKQADQIVDMCATLARAAREVTGADVTIACSAPVSTSDGGEPPSEPCQCPACTIGAALRALMGAADTERAPASVSAPESGPQINAIPERGPWGAS